MLTSIVYSFVGKIVGKITKFFDLSCSFFWQMFYCKIHDSNSFLWIFSLITYKKINENFRKAWDYL